MLIEKPRCNFKNCRYCFDGNCKSADKYENCKLTDLHSEIAKLTVDLDNAKSEWISVKERQPERHARVLCYYKFEPESPDVICENIYYGRSVDGYLWLFDSSEVTHWMPLPEAPKEE